MDTAVLIAFLQESLFLIVVFAFFLILAISFGRQTITNIILGLYFAFLISLQFPYYSNIATKSQSAQGQAIFVLGIFFVFLAIATLLFIHILPREYDEKAFEGFWKKLLLAVAATALVPAFSYHALPITDFITPGSPVQYLFGSEKSFFWWLLAPILVLFVT